MVSYVLQCNFQRDSRADFTRESLDAAPLSRIALLQQKKSHYFTIFAGRNREFQLDFWVRLQVRFLARVVML